MYTMDYRDCSGVLVVDLEVILWGIVLGLFLFGVWELKKVLEKWLEDKWR